MRHRHDLRERQVRGATSWPRGDHASAAALPEQRCNGHKHTHRHRATYLHILAGGRVAAGQRECEMHMLCIHSHSGCELVYRGGAESLTIAGECVYSGDATRLSRGTFAYARDPYPVGPMPKPDCGAQREREKGGGPLKVGRLSKTPNVLNGAHRAFGIVLKRAHSGRLKGSRGRCRK